MARRIFFKVLWVGRATVFLVGLAVILALLFGMASMAFARDGQAFLLGERNVAQSLSTLVKKGTGPALSLQVGSGAPLKVNSQVRVAKLNADMVDGKHASAIGVNGLEQVTQSSTSNSNSAKLVAANCPPGKILVGSGYDIVGGKSGGWPNEVSKVVIDEIRPSSTDVLVHAYEEEPIGDNWWVQATAICATAP